MTIYDHIWYRLRQRWDCSSRCWFCTGLVLWTRCLWKMEPSLAEVGLFFFFFFSVTGKDDGFHFAARWFLSCFIQDLVWFHISITRWVTCLDSSDRLKQLDLVTQFSERESTKCIQNWRNSGQTAQKHLESEDSVNSYYCSMFLLETRTLRTILRSP